MWKNYQDDWSCRRKFSSQQMYGRDMGGICSVIAVVIGDTKRAGRILSELLEFVLVLCQYATKGRNECCSLTALCRFVGMDEGSCVTPLHCQMFPLQPLTVCLPTKSI